MLNFINKFVVRFDDSVNSAIRTIAKVPFFGDLAIYGLRYTLGLVPFVNVLFAYDKDNLIPTLKIASFLDTLNFNKILDKSLLKDLKKSTLLKEISTTKELFFKQ